MELSGLFLAEVLWRCSPMPCAPRPVPGVLSFFEASVAISAVDHGGVTVDLNRHPLVVDLLILHLAVDGAGEKFFLVHQGAVVIDIQESVCEELVERGGILALFRMVPGSFESAQVAFLTAGFRRFLGNDESG